MKKTQLTLLLLLLAMLIGVSQSAWSIVFFSPKNIAFIDFFKPKILAVNQQILVERHQVLALQQQSQILQHLASADYEYLFNLGKRYKVRECAPAYWAQKACFQSLLKKVDGLPVNLVLAQAINESNWGRSRFARKGNNYFGIWCYIKGCGLVPRGRDKNASFEVQRFQNASKSIAWYYHLLNTHLVYQDLRITRANMRKDGKPLNAYQLANSLEGYSARKQAYVKSIQKIIQKLIAGPVSSHSEKA